MNFTTGLQGYWLMDEGTGLTTADASGNGRDGTLTNAPTWGSGKCSNGVVFGASFNYIDCGNVSAFDIVNQDFTLSIWLYLVGFAASTSNLMGKSSVGNGWLFYYMGSGGVLKFGAPGVNESYCGGDLLVNNTNQWAMYTITCISGALLFYKNGVPSPSIGNGAAGAANTTPMSIGNGIGVPLGQPVIGTLDMAAIWVGRGLNEAEVAILYQYQNTCKDILNIPDSSFGGGRQRSSPYNVPQHYHRH